ncbi:MAG: hypothetical protein H6510_16490 [Acidobacteria bacterium]|nr:hypothetical protein [Acidobacteriota bacterium]MCB9399413.1 hypothetical protein [Acidobacteriota bacterium]
MIRMLLMFSLLFSWLGWSQVPTAQSQEVAQVLSQAALYIFDSDFVMESPENQFTPRQLEIMEQNKEALLPMIEAALGRQESVGGSELLAQFHWTELNHLVRARLLNPGRAYGWEGSTDLLDDRQFVFHNRYLIALQKLYGPHFHSKLALTEAEKDELFTLSHSKDSQHCEWAIWLMRKLELE